MLGDDLEGWVGVGVRGRLKREGMHVYIKLVDTVV